MNTKKILIGGIAGGVVYFLLGWVFYGLLFVDFFKSTSGTATGVMKPMDQMIWWALIVGNILAGFLMAYVIAKAGVKSLAGGLTTGFIIGLLTSGGYDLVSYATSNIMQSKGVIADVAIYAVMSAITGAVVGLIFGKIKD